MSEKKPRKKLSILEWIVVGAGLAVFVAIGIFAIFARIADHREITEGKGAKLIYFAIQQMAMDGKAKHDKTLGWPADAGIRTTAELKAKLISGKYCTERDLRSWCFDKFQIGNVSENDSPNTICLRCGAGNEQITFYKGGFEKSDARKDPPRTPAYLPKE